MAIIRDADGTFAGERWLLEAGRCTDATGFALPGFQRLEEAACNTYTDGASFLPGEPHGLLCDPLRLGNVADRLQHVQRY